MNVTSRGKVVSSTGKSIELVEQNIKPKTRNIK